MSPTNAAPELLQRDVLSLSCRRGTGC